MPPEANLKDKPRAGNPEQEAAPTGLLKAGTGRLDQSALTRMRSGNADSAPSLTLEGSANSRADKSNASDRTNMADQPLPGAVQPKTKAFTQAPTFPNSMKYQALYHNGAIEIEQRWQNNTTSDPNRPDGTMTGLTRYVADNKSVHLYWRQEQNGQKKPEYAVESSTDAAGNTTHNYFDYTIDEQGQARIDYSKDRGQIVVHADDKGATRGGFVRAPKAADGNCELTVFDNNTDVISKKSVKDTDAHNPTVLASIEQEALRSPNAPVERVATADPAVKAKTGAESGGTSQARTKEFVTDSASTTPRSKSTEKLPDGSTIETINNADGTRTQRHLLGSRLVVTDLDNSGHMRQTSSYDEKGKLVTQLTYDATNSAEPKITLSHQNDRDQKMVTRSWICKDKDSNVNKIWSELPSGQPSDNAQRTCHNLTFNIDQGSWQFRDEKGVLYKGNCKNNEVVQDKSADELDRQERKNLGDAAYETQRADLQKKLEARGISFSDNSGIKMTMPDKSTRLMPTDAPTLAQLKAVEKAMERFLPSNQSKLKDPVKFTFLKENMDDANGRYTDSGNIFIYPQASRIQSCLQADTGVGHRTASEDAGESLEATIAHEYTHLIEEPILNNNETKRAYANSYGVDWFADPENHNIDAWAIQGKDEYEQNGEKKYSLYKASSFSRNSDSYSCSVTLGSEGKPVLDIKSTGEQTYTYYERRNPDGSKYINENGDPERLWDQQLMKVARLRPGSPYLTGVHAATEARTQFALGGLSREHLFQNSALYEQAKVDDAKYIGEKYIRTWEGKIVPKTPELVREIQEKEKKLKPYIRPA